jgi:hypothetical protein
MNKEIGIEIKNDMIGELIVDIEKHMEILGLELGVKIKKEHDIVKFECSAADVLFTKLILIKSSCRKKIVKIDLDIEELKVLKDALHCNNTIFKDTTTTEMIEFENYIQNVYKKALEKNMSEI